MKEGGEPHWLWRTQMLNFVNTEAPKKIDTAFQLGLCK